MQTALSASSFFLNLPVSCLNKDLLVLSCYFSDVPFLSMAVFCLCIIQDGHVHAKIFYLDF